MAKAIPEERLRGVWEMLTAQFGAVKSIDERRSGELKGYRAVELILSLRKRGVVQRTCSTATARSPGWPISLRAWRCFPPPSDAAPAPTRLRRVLATKGRRAESFVSFVVLLSVDTEREEPIAPAALDARSRVAGTPVHRPVDHGRPGVHRAQGRVLPQDLAGGGIQREKLILACQLRHRAPHTAPRWRPRLAPDPRRPRLTKPGIVSSCGSAVCQMICPVSGSSAAHDPPVATVFEITPFWVSL